MILAAVHEVDLGLLDFLVPQLERTFRVRCRIRPGCLDAGAALDPARGQYYSTAILAALCRLDNERRTRILGVTALDLYVPVLTFVFGEAQLAGPCALVSSHRLREEVYGLPANRALLEQRVLKESVHELGHTFGLRHCDDWRCVMASSHGVEYLDVKEPEFCRFCRRAIG